MVSILVEGQLEFVSAIPQARRSIYAQSKGKGPSSISPSEWISVVDSSIFVCATCDRDWLSGSSTWCGVQWADGHSYFLPLTLNLTVRPPETSSYTTSTPSTSSSSKIPSSPLIPVKIGRLVVFHGRFARVWFSDFIFRRLSLSDVKAFTLRFLEMVVASLEPDIVVHTELIHFYFTVLPIVVGHHLPSETTRTRFNRMSHRSS